jgi:hypothetical protein
MRFVAFCAIAFVLGASPVCAADFGPAKGWYAVSISTPKAEYKLGEDITLTLTIQNVGFSPIHVYDECQTHGRTRIVVIDMNGVSLPVHPQRIVCSGSNPEHSLAPGAEESHEFSLLKDVALTLPSGTFTIQMVYTGWNTIDSPFVFRDRVNPAVRYQAALMANGFVRSNVIFVTVTP